MANQPQAPFYAPRPPDPQNWQWAPNGDRSIVLTASQAKIFGQHGQAPTKPWRYDFEPDKYWQGSPLIAYTVNQKISLNLTINNDTPAWHFDYVDRPPDWSPLAQATVPQTLLKQNQPFNKYWRYDTITDTYWQGAPQSQPLIQQAFLYAATLQWFIEPPPDQPWMPDLTELIANTLYFGISGGNPFHIQWRYDVDTDVRTWMPNTDNLSANTLYALTAGGTPKHQQWRYDFVPPTEWTWLPPPSDPIRLLTQGVTPFHFQWHTDLDTDVKPWMPTPDSLTSNVLYLLTYGGSPLHIQWRYDFVPPTDWVWQPPPSDPIRLLTEATPFHQQWRYDYEPDKFWLGQSTADQTLLHTIFLNPFHQQWRYDLNTDTWWAWQPPPSSAINFATAIGFTYPFHHQWRYDYEPDKFWLGTPLGEPLTLSVVVEAPFFQQWRYDLEPDKFWLGQPTSFPSDLFELTEIYSIAPVWYWLYDFNPEPFWPGTPILSRTVRLPKLFKPLNVWRYHNVPDTYWTWQPPPSDAMRFAVTTRFPVPTSKNLTLHVGFDFDMDVKPWMPTLANLQAQPLTIMNLYNVPPLWDYSFEPDKYWTGSPIPATESLLATAVPLAPFHQQWRYDTDTDVRSWMPLADNLRANALAMLSGRPYHKQWRYDLVPETYWQGTPVANFVIEELIPASKLWRYDLVPVPDWTWQPPASDSLRLLTGGGEPFSKQDWRYDFHIEQPLWLWVPPRNQSITGITPKPSTPTFSWLTTYVPPTDWLWQPPPSDTLRLVTELQPFFSKAWHYDFDIEIKPWMPTADNLTANTLYILFQKPKNKQLWRYDLDTDVKPWMPTLQNLRASTPYQLFTHPTSPQHFWRYDYHIEQPLWLWEPPISWPLYLPVAVNYTITLGSGAYTYTGQQISFTTGSLVRPNIGLNVFTAPIFSSVSEPLLFSAQAHRSALAHPTVGQPATLFIPLVGANDLPVSPLAVQNITLTINRPDGSFYRVATPSPAVYLASLFGSEYLVYQTQVGELNEAGWWQITFNAGESAPGGYVFYVGPPFPEVPSHNIGN